MVGRETSQFNEQRLMILPAPRRIIPGTTVRVTRNALVKFTSRKLGPDKGRSVYLMTLFPGNPALLGAKIAGLPRPENCF